MLEKKNRTTKKERDIYRLDAHRKEESTQIKSNLYIYNVSPLTYLTYWWTYTLTQSSYRVATKNMKTTMTIPNHDKLLLPVHIAPVGQGHQINYTIISIESCKKNRFYIIFKFRVILFFCIHMIILIKQGLVRSKVAKLFKTLKIES